VGMFWRKHTVEFFFNVKTGWRTIYEDWFIHNGTSQGSLYHNK
jgi:hypothetical protein